MSTIAQTYVTLAERIAARLAFPRVRALHVPSHEAFTQRGAEFCAVELDGGAVGCSFVLLDGVEAWQRVRPDPAAYAGMDAATLAQRYGEANLSARMLGFAAINALSQQLFSRAGFTPPAPRDSLGDIAPKQGENIGMIGLFPPLVAAVAQAGARLTVLELKPELAGDHGTHRVTLDPAELASCDKVVSTCSVMLNDTLDQVLEACRNARLVAIVGPTAGCLPDPLFARGVHSIGGRRVVDLERFRATFCEGGKWGTFAPKYVIARDAYPGIDELLERID